MNKRRIKLYSELDSFIRSKRKEEAFKAISRKDTFKLRQSATNVYNSLNLMLKQRRMKNSKAMAEAGQGAGGPEPKSYSVYDLNEVEEYSDDNNESSFFKGILSKMGIVFESRASEAAGENRENIVLSNMPLEGNESNQDMKQALVIISNLINQLPKEQAERFIQSSYFRQIKELNDKYTQE